MDGEEIISKLLYDRNITFAKEYSFSNLKSDLDGLLRFDFAIFDNQNNLKQFIEYDGEQHFQAVDIWGGENGLVHRQNNDKKKDLYCKIHNIKLVRIPYWKLRDLTFEDLEININELS